MPVLSVGPSVRIAPALIVLSEDRDIKVAHIAMGKPGRKPGNAPNVSSVRNIVTTVYHVTYLMTYPTYHVYLFGYSTAITIRIIS